MENQFVPSASLDSYAIPMDVKTPLIDPSSNPENFTNIDTLKAIVTNNMRPDRPSTVPVINNNSNHIHEKHMIRYPSNELKLSETPKKLVIVSQLKTEIFYQALFSEFIGTMLLTLIATSTCLPIASKSVPDLHGALVSSFIIATIIVGFGHISGAHVNPAVTVTFLVSAEIDVIRAVCYIVMQSLGAICGSSLLCLLVPSDVQSNLGLTMITRGVSIPQAIIIEIIITFILCFTVHAVCDKQRDDIGGSKALAVGLAVIVGCLFGGPYTGASMNPARSLGPAVLMNSWKNHWVYWFGPMIGAILAAFIYKYALKTQPTTVEHRGSNNYTKLNHI
jgi:MIP family channel proteins